jgi:hypothetical protein
MFTIIVLPLVPDIKRRFKKLGKNRQWMQVVTKISKYLRRVVEPKKFVSHTKAALDKI